MIAAGIFLAGLVALVIGAELVVRGAVFVAQRLRISPLVIGLTVVAVGTSAPELAVGVEAALAGAGDLAVGNIAGTNSLNLLFILGLVALLRPLRLQRQTVRVDLPAIVAASALMLAVSLDGLLSRWDAVPLLLLGVVYTIVIARNARRAQAGAETLAVSESTTPPSARPLRTATRTSLVLAVAALFGGIVIIVVGADWLVDSAIAIARALDVPEAVIGLTIVAIGTSAPELVTAVVSTIRNARDVAVGNLLGSSVYNIVFILGITVLVPSGGIRVPPALLAIDLPMMLLAAVVCIPVFLTGMRIRRFEGAAFMTLYLGYLAYLLIART